MIAVTTPSKKHLKTLVGKNIDNMIIETSMWNKEFTGNDKGIPFVYPGPYQRKGFGQLWTENGILTKVK